MKKVIFTLVVIGSLVANADYLYWMVDDNATLNGAQLSSTDWSSAAFYVDTSSTPLSTATADDLDLWGYGVASGTFNSAATYYIEIFSDTGYTTSLGKQWFTGSQVLSLVTGDNSIMPPGSSVLLANAFSSAVPEPTSGLLFIIGGVLLGLKRRREVV